MRPRVFPTPENVPTVSETLSWVDRGNPLLASQILTAPYCSFWSRSAAPLTRRPSASALRSLFVPRACRCSLSQSKRDAAATTACLLPRAISPPMLTALFFCLASADRICLLRHCITFADFTTNILTDSPMSCSTFLSGTIAVLYCTVMCTVHSFGRRRSHRIAVPLAQHCDG